MYRRSKFLEVLQEIRQEMALEADYELDSFARIARSGNNREQEVANKTGSELIFESFILENVSKTKTQKPKSKK